MQLEGPSRTLSAHFRRSARQIVAKRGAFGVDAAEGATAMSTDRSVGYRRAATAATRIFAGRWARATAFQRLRGRSWVLEDEPRAGHLLGADGRPMSERRKASARAAPAHDELADSHAILCRGLEPPPIERCAFQRREDAFAQRCARGVADEDFRRARALAAQT